MRYQYPAPTPLGHYWEEEIVRVWGVRFGISRRTAFYFNYLLGEIIFANFFLAIQIIANQSLVLSVKRSVLSISRRINIAGFSKRTIDIIGALSGMVLTSPIWILLAIAIKLDSRGPIFYTQERVGQNRRRGNRRAVGLPGRQERRSSSDRRQAVGYGKSFFIFKFRSMRADAESQSGPTWAKKNDSRVTRVGRFIRATRLDELPQLINVLLGNMSLVGPRPERPCFVVDLNSQIKNYSQRFNVKPGITGLAQVEHKYDECIEDVSKKISYDLRYIRNWSVFQDMRIILRTVVVVLTARGM
jgi:lipopolysaccharide/colanic/teichoic acid biosynthesis glycosyltransferase